MVIDRLLELFENSEEKLHIELLTYFLLFFTVVTLLDFLTGLIASKKSGIPIVSSGIGASIGKIISIILLYILVLLTLLVPGLGFVVRFPAYYAMFLLTLREIVSILENFEGITGVKITMASFLDSIYQILVGRFFKKIKGNSYDRSEYSETNRLPDREPRSPGRDDLV